MAEKKDAKKEEKEKEESFTGSPEEQFPDLEAEDSREQPKGKTEKKKGSDKPKKD
ncbi:hypothetical protein DHX103_00160 [Planococcus sp. X10-3]|uniref:hypothetical protein n=1 Tax=Planococcus sp. X10-3 TaxID=3061240 RepID=UPI003BB1322B